jgi:hypothetical protein
MTPGEPPYKLNVGCGRNIKEGWINLDSAPLPGVDLVCDLEDLRARPIALPDESVSQFLVSHAIERIRDSLDLMQELSRLATPGAIAMIRVPHGGCDDAWEDPTHLRAYYPGSFGYFSQPMYANADYGYRADWSPDRLTLLVHRSLCAGLSPQEIISKSQVERNVVKEMICGLRAVKPAQARARAPARIADARADRNRSGRLSRGGRKVQKKARREEDSGQGGPFSGSGRRDSHAGGGAIRSRRWEFSRCCAPRSRARRVPPGQLVPRATAGPPRPRRARPTPGLGRGASAERARVRRDP